MKRFNIHIIIFFIFAFACSHILFSQTEVDTLNNKIAKTEISSDSTIDSTKEVKSSDKNLITPPSISDLISFEKIVWAVIFFFIGLYIIKLISKILELFAERSTKYRISIKGIIPVLRIIGWALVIYIIIAGVFQPPAATLLAVAASLGIAIGFAAQDIFKNIFGGIMILFDRPFQVGDKIEVGKYYGEVVKIGLRSTRIVTPGDSLVSIPNSEIMTNSVSNSNAGEPNCQVVAEIYLPITIDTEIVRQIATEAAQVSKYIYLNKPITVLFFNEMNEKKPFYKMYLKAYVMDIRYEFNFKSNMTELIMKELLEQKIISPESFN